MGWCCLHFCKGLGLDEMKVFFALITALFSVKKSGLRADVQHLPEGLSSPALAL